METVESCGDTGILQNPASLIMNNKCAAVETCIRGTIKQDKSEVTDLSSDGQGYRTVERLTVHI